MKDPIIIPLKYKKYKYRYIGYIGYIGYIESYTDKLRSAPNHFVNIIGSLYQLL